MGQQYQQQNQQQQEQGWLQQVRQELHSGQTLRPQMGQMQTTMGQQGQNASLATMDPTTYQNSPYVSQQFRQQPPAKITLQQPMYQQFYTNPNASIATMGPDTYQNSPYTQHGFQMSQQYQQQNQQQQEQEWLQQVRQELQSGQTLNHKWAKWDKWTNANHYGTTRTKCFLSNYGPHYLSKQSYVSQQFRQQNQPNYQQQPIRIQGQLRQNMLQQGPNASLATMDQPLTKIVL